MNTIVNSGTRPVQLVVSLVAMGLLTVVMRVWALAGVPDLAAASP